MLVHVDDFLRLGPRAAIDSFVSKMRERFDFEVSFASDHGDSFEYLRLN